MEQIFSVLFPLFIFFLLFLGFSSKRKDTGQICSLCKGTGQVRSGQWGGFKDTCIRCQGKGIV